MPPRNFNPHWVPFKRINDYLALAASNPNGPEVETKRVDRSMPAAEPKQSKNHREFKSARSFAWRLLLISALLPIHANAKVNSQSKEIAYRKIDFPAIICKKPEAKFTAESIYLVKRIYERSSNSAKREYRSVAIKFSTGARYRATYSTSPDGNPKASLAERGSQFIKLDCKTWAQSLTDYSQFRDSSLGYYIQRVGISYTGAYGPDVVTEVCKMPGHCDYGTEGIILKSQQGEEIWARFIAVKDGNKMGHPSYILPKLQAISDDKLGLAYLLDDDSIILIYDDTAAIRVSVKDGRLMRVNKNVSSVDLKDWAELKGIYHERFLGSKRYCSETEGCYGRVNLEMYFYSLQLFLFPKSIKWR